MRSRSKRVGKRVLAACALAVPCGGGSVRAQSPQCVAAYGAMMKLWEIPWHLSMIDSAGTDAPLHGGKPAVAEEIFIGGVVYIKVKGEWRQSPINIAEMKKDGAQKMAADKSTCVHVRDENIGAEGASVWAVHSVTEDGATDLQLWISKRRGVVLKSETRTDVGGSMGKSHMLASYEYGNVHAPLVAR